MSVLNSQLHVENTSEYTHEDLTHIEDGCKYREGTIQVTGATNDLVKATSE
jgi:hypothetical protein